MADKILSKIKIGENIYNLKDAEGRTLIAAEETRATGVEGGLDDRIKSLEARGRYLSTWDASTGLPGDYPQIPEGAESPYTYTFKAGDYYIINNIPATGTKYMPDGASITATKEGDVWTWSVGKKAYAGEASLVVGGQFVYSTSGWNYVATAKDTAWGQIIGTLSNQTDLQAALDAKAATADLGDLAFKDNASGTFNTQTITGVKATGTLTAEVTGDLGFAAENASLTKGDYTPAGEITGSAISGGSINVTVKDAASATAVTDLEYENYTPAGTIAAASGGDFAAVKDAEFVPDAEGVQITGTINSPAINLTSASQDILTGVATAGTVPSFTEGAFSAAAIQSGFFSAGSVAFGSFNAGAMPTLGEATKGSFATAGLIFSAYSADDEMITFGDATLASAVTAQGALSGGAVPTWTGSSVTAPAIDTAKFFGGSKAADTWDAGAMPTFASGSFNKVTAAALASDPVFTGGKFGLSLSKDTALKSVAFTGTSAAIKLTGAKYLKQEISAATFSGTAATLGFSGSTFASGIVTGVSYSKATKGTLAATAALPSGGLAVGDIVVASQEITVA